MEDTGNLDALTVTLVREFGHALGFVQRVLEDFQFIDPFTGEFTGPHAVAANGENPIALDQDGDNWDEIALNGDIMAPGGGVSTTTTEVVPAESGSVASIDVPVLDTAGIAPGMFVYGERIPRGSVVGIVDNGVVNILLPGEQATDEILLNTELFFDRTEISQQTLGLFHDIGYEVNVNANVMSQETIALLENLGFPPNNNAPGFVLDPITTVAGGTASYVRPDGTFNPVIRDPRLPAAVARSRPSGRLAIDPGVTVKLQNSRIELERGTAQLIAEGHDSQPIILTSLNDNRFGTGYQFNTNGNQSDLYDRGNPLAFDPDSNTGQWGGIVVSAAASASIDNAHITFAGGKVPIEGAFASFNPIEVHQGALRLANSRLEFNASGKATSDRNSRGSNDGATVFVRSAQPIIVGNDFRRNEGSVISINANALNDSEIGDIGRQSGSIARYEQYDDNHGPLIRDNRISYVNSATSETQQPSEFDIDLVFDDSLNDGSAVSEKNQTGST